jgi:hypothetical protein
MQRSSVPKLAVLALALSAPTTLFADFTYQETTQMTGGSMLSMMKMAGAFSSKIRKIGEPVVSSIYIHGNRMARVNAEEIEVIDLDNETITHIDPNKRTYTVMTFQQMRDQAAKARQEAEKRQAEHPQSAPVASPDADKVKMSYDVHVRNTGAAKQVSGLDAIEAILTMMMNATDQKSQQTGTMAVTNDMWMVPDIPGYGEVRIFYAKFGAKMGTVAQAAGMDMSALLAQNPGASQAMAGIAQEMQKLSGVPVMQVMRVGTTTDGKPLPAASEAPLPPDNSPAMPSGGDIAKQSAASMLTSHFGLGGFGRKKQSDPPPADPNAKPVTSVVLMETQTTVTSFSSAPVDATRFEVPAGFKLVTR